MRDQSSNRSTSTRHAPWLLAAVILFIVQPIARIPPWPPRLVAQGSDARRFEVVSIRRNTSDAQGGTSQGGPGRFTATNISLHMLIRNAYRMLDSQIVGGSRLTTPDYMSAQKFDINATFAGEATPEERAAMVRNMLADRFKLVTHRETREMPVFVLMMARTDGRLGPQLKSAEDPTCSSAAALQERDAARGGPPASGGPAGRAGGSGPNCGSLQFGPGRYLARAVPIAQLATSLGNQAQMTSIDRVILERTNLAGKYDFELAWRMPARPAGALASGAAPPAADNDLPDLFVALQEQLGLKLEPQRAPVEILVIDSVDMPSEN